MPVLSDVLNPILKKTAGIDLDLIKFLIRERFVPFDVPEVPFFDCEETVAWFLAALGSARRYLEYGTGGSTYAAAKLGVGFVAVESDPFFLKSLRQKIRKDGLEKDAGQIFHYADIGLTGYVGEPLYSWRATEKRLAKFRRYSDPPQECFEGGHLPDLVLVDGRFRVACALKALRMLRSESGWTLVVDDYVNRPQYRAIENFAEIDSIVGTRMAVFRSMTRFDQQALEAAIREYETVPA